MTVRMGWLTVCGAALTGLSGMAASEPVPAPMPTLTMLTCAGDGASPWRLVLDGEDATFARAVPGMGEAHWDLSGRAWGGLDTGLMWRGRGDGLAADLVAFVRRGEDGGDDRGNGPGWRVDVALPQGGALRGSCRAGDLADGVAGRAGDGAGHDAGGPSSRAQADAPWWERVHALMPALDACLLRSEGVDVRVTKAWRRDDGRIAARTRDAYGAWWGCVASADGAEVTDWAALSADSPELPGEGLVVFTGAGNGQPVRGACYQNHQRVETGDGRLLGWLSDLIC